MRVISILCCAVLLGVQGGQQPKVVEKAVPIMEDAIARTCHRVLTDPPGVVTCEPPGKVLVGRTCADKTRVLLYRENGEAICVDFDHLFCVPDGPPISPNLARKP